MCGICGFISKQNINIDELTAMNDTMYHRGPDDAGVEIYPMSGSLSGYSIGLAQRRLSILDLSPLGHQPMHSKDKRLSVVYNGEIYNFKEIKKELSDYQFLSNCDTEVIIAAYLKWGIECVYRFNGMFAICLYDKELERVYLIRDRIGKKPLYYEIDGNNLIFASTLGPIMSRPGFKKNIDRRVISRYLYQQCINGPESVFENVYKLEPGAILEYSSTGIKTYKYWDVATVYEKSRKNPISDYEQAKSELKELLTTAVRNRMISDVPLGAFLSGGYDSSLITAIAQSVSDEPVKTFSIGFNEEKYNEAKYAKKVADYLGTNHTEVYIDEEEMYRQVSSIAKYYDEPFADSSQIPSMLVAGVAKEKVTVALSGDGGDEFYCGYNIYENIKQAQMLDGIGAMTHGVCGLFPGLENKLPFKVRVIAANRNPLSKTQFGATSYVTKANGMVLGEGIPCQYEIEDRYNVSNWQIKRMLLDMDTYLPGDILCKVDRATMKYSLEARCPILDRDVMEYSFRMNHDIKYSRGIKKRILKDIAYDYIPKELLERPKVGFSVPLDKWMRGPLKEELLAMCDKNYLTKQGIFDAEYVNSVIGDFIVNGDGGSGTGANYSKLAWSFFVFQQWYSENME